MDPADPANLLVGDLAARKFSLELFFNLMAEYLNYIETFKQSSAILQYHSAWYIQKYKIQGASLKALYVFLL